MRAVVQRVLESSVEIQNPSGANTPVSQIGHGLMILLGVSQDDTVEDSIYLAEKIAGLRIFPDAAGKMNLSILDVGGAALVVSQFTLYGDCRKGRRPSFSTAATANEADKLYEHFSESLGSLGVPISQGAFQQDMLVKIYNDGPVTMLLDSKKDF